MVDFVGTDEDDTFVIIGPADNRLNGMGGNDYLSGGSGNDILDGGADGDYVGVYVQKARSSGRNRSFEATFLRIV